MWNDLDGFVDPSFFPDSMFSNERKSIFFLHESVKTGVFNRINFGINTIWMVLSTCCNLDISFFCYLTGTSALFPACNVLYINSVEMESLTGPQAVAKAISETLAASSPATATIVHFKVSSQGITLTDNQRK